MTIRKIFTRDFVLSFFTQFVFSVVFCMLVPTIPIYLLQFAAKESEIGFLVGMISVSALVLRPLVGRGLLTIPEKTFMLAGALIYTVSCLAYLIAPPFWPLLAVRVLHGVGVALFSTASFTFALGIIPEAHRGQLTSIFYLANNLAFALGPYAGMVLINHFSFVVLFSACAALSLCALIMTTKMRKRVSVMPGQKEEIEGSFLSREALPAATIALMTIMIWGTLSAFIPLYALKHGMANPGIFFVFMAATIILGRSCGGWLLDIWGREKIILPCLMLIIAGLILLVFSESLTMFILVAMVLGMGWSLLFPSLLLLAIEQAGPAHGPAMGTFTALADLGMGLGPMIMGSILQITSYPVMFSCLVLTAVINFFLLFRCWKKTRTQKPPLTWNCFLFST